MALQQYKQQLLDILTNPRDDFVDDLEALRRSSRQSTYGLDFTYMLFIVRAVGTQALGDVINVPNELTDNGAQSLDAFYDQLASISIFLAMNGRHLRNDERSNRLNNEVHSLMNTVRPSIGGKPRRRKSSLTSRKLKSTRQ